MKKKDLIYLLLAVGILLAAGYLGYTQLLPSQTTGTTTQSVDKVGVIPDSLDGSGLAAMNDSSKAVDFNSPVDLSGLSNQAPFGP